MMIEAVGPIKRKFAPWDDSTLKPFIRFENVTKRFGDFTAVDNLTLDIYEREFFALLGPSGCGKTTLMRMLAGFEEPTEGRILLQGKDISGVPPYRRPTNMMFQSYALFPHMSVEKNVGYGLKHERMTAVERQDRVREMLELAKGAARLDRLRDGVDGRLLRVGCGHRPVLLSRWRSSPAPCRPVGGGGDEGRIRVSAP